MKIEEMHIGMEVRHPQYGSGKVKALDESRAKVEFSDATRDVAPGLSELVPIEATAALRGVDMPLKEFIADVVESAVDRLGLSRPEDVVEQLGSRWSGGGQLVIKPKDPELQSKEVDLETFFHKIVMVRNNLRVLEQKINGLDMLSSAQKFDFQQYITKSYGSLTTFNVLFKSKDDHFSSQKH